MYYGVATELARAGQRELAFQWLSRRLSEGMDRRAAIAEDAAWADYKADTTCQRLAGVRLVAANRVAAWREDLEFFLEEARRLHAAPRSPARTEEFAREVRSLADRAGGLSDLEMVLGVQRLLVALGDGHSQIREAPRGPGDGSLARFARALPIRVRVFSDGIYVVAAEPGFANLLGRPLTQVGGRPVAEAVAAVSAWLSRDNETWPRLHGAESLLMRGRYLDATGLSRGDSVLVRVGEGSSSQELILPIRMSASTADWARVDSVPRRNPPPPGPAVLSELEAGRVALFTFRAVSNAPGRSLADVARDLDGMLSRSSRPQALVIDIRENGGGNNGLLLPIERAIVRYAYSEPAARILVLTGPHTFSAAQNFATRIERLVRPEFIGEPTGSRPNHVGEVSQVRLPHSQLALSISSRYWQDSNPLDGRQWIYPEILVAPTFEEWRSGRDPVLEVALQRAMREEGR